MSKPPVEVPQGAIRFNTDSQKMEFFAQDQWWEMATDVPNLGGNGCDTTDPTGNSPDQSLGARGVFAGSGPSTATTMDYINIESAGDAIYFCDNATSINYSRQGSSRTRGYIGNDVNQSNVVSTYVFASAGGAVDYGDLTQAAHSGCFVTNQTRAVAFEGMNPSTSVMSYTTMATTGVFYSFGSMKEAVRHIDGFGSPTRGVVPGGWKADPGGNWEGIQYVTIPTTGNAQDFGEVTVSQSLRGYAASSNSIRGVYGGGTLYPGGAQASIEYVTIATKGNGVNFGDLTYSNRQEGGGCASPVRAIFAGGYQSPASDVINYVSIATQGDAVDFGNLTVARACGGASNAHGGL